MATGRGECDVDRHCHRITPVAMTVTSGDPVLVHRGVRVEQSPVFPPQTAAGRDGRTDGLTDRMMKSTANVTVNSHHLTCPSYPSCPACSWCLPWLRVRLLSGVCGCPASGLFAAWWCPALWGVRVCWLGRPAWSWSWRALRAVASVPIWVWPGPTCGSLPGVAATAVHRRGRPCRVGVVPGRSRVVARGWSCPCRCEWVPALGGGTDRWRVVPFGTVVRGFERAVVGCVPSAGRVTVVF